MQVGDSDKERQLCVQTGLHYHPSTSAIHPGLTHQFSYRETWLMREETDGVLLPSWREGSH